MALVQASLHRQRFSCGLVVGDVRPDLVEISVIHRNGCFLFIVRFVGNHVYQASHGVSAIERSLRAAQHFNAFHIIKIEIESRFFEVGNFIHIQSHRRRVDAVSHPADINRRREFRTVVGHKKVGNDG